MPEKRKDLNSYTPLLPDKVSRPSGHDLEADSTGTPLQSRFNISSFFDARFFGDVTIGLSDGLTVPFALTAGLSALGDSNVIIYGGLAELVAGAISMGLGGFLSAKSEREAYIANLESTSAIVSSDPDATAELVRECFSTYNFPQATLDAILCTLREQDDDGEQMKKFLMCFHHQQSGDSYSAAQAYLSGLTVALGYVSGGLVPLAPYLIVSDPAIALRWSILVMALALFAFGWVKTAVIGVSSWRNCSKSAVEMVVLGGVAAAAAIGNASIEDGLQEPQPSNSDELSSVKASATTSWKHHPALSLHQHPHATHHPPYDVEISWKMESGMFSKTRC